MQTAELGRAARRHPALEVVPAAVPGRRVPAARLSFRTAMEESSGAGAGVLAGSSQAFSPPACRPWENHPHTTACLPPKGTSLHAGVLGPQWCLQSTLEAVEVPTILTAAIRNAAVSTDR